MNKFSVLLLSLTLLTACNPDKQAAQAQFNKAQALYEQTQYGHAKQALDTLKALFPKEHELQRKGLQLMRRIELSEQERNQVYCDSMLQVKQAEAKALQQAFTYEKTEYDETGRYIDKTWNPTTDTRGKFLKINVNELGEVALSSVYSGAPIKHNRLKVTTPTGEYAETEAIAFDGGANFSFQDIAGVTYETVTYQKGRDNGVLNFICSQAKKRLSAQLVGGKSTAPFTVSEKEKQAIVKTVALSAALSDIERLKFEQAKAAQRIEYLRSHLDETN
jgi:hypothetical protein